jgi:hypothetical protein
MDNKEKINFYSSKNNFIQEFIDILKKDEVKNQCKLLFNPFFEIIFYEIKPYIYIIFFLIFLIFFLLFLIIFLLVFILRNILKNN